jgi:hypothetical protein
MEEEENLMDKLILSGAMEINGINEDGSFLYIFTDKLKDIAPEVHEQVTLSFFSELMRFWELGFLGGDITQEDPQIFVTPKCFNAEARQVLTETQNKNLDIIIKSFQKDS